MLESDDDIYRKARNKADDIFSKINTYIPTREALFGPFEDTFNKFCDGFMDDFGINSLKGKVGYPKLDVYAVPPTETGMGHWIVEVAVPGMEAADLTVELLPEAKPPNAFALKEPAGRILKISGQMATGKHWTDANACFVKELRRSHFERQVVVPEFIKGEPDTTLKNGILSLVWEVPMNKPAETKKLQIKTN